MDREENHHTDIPLAWMHALMLEGPTSGVPEVQWMYHSIYYARSS